MQLKDYQKLAVKFLHTRKKGLLEMGCRTGKSRVALIAAQKKGKVLIICPPALAINWQREIKKTFGFKNPYYEILKTTQKDLISVCRPDVLILDEAHRSAKWNTSEEIIRVAKKTDYVFLLTATGLIHSPMDLYWPLKLTKAHNLTRRDFCIRYAGGEIKFNNIVIPTQPTNTIEFKALCKNASFQYSPKLNIKKSNIFIGQCGQKTNDLKNYSKLQKIISFQKAVDKKTKKILNILTKKHKKVIIFYYHKIVSSALKNKIPCIDGSVHIATRYKIIQEFKSKDKAVLFLNYKSCGEGLDVPADACIFLEKSWSFNLDYQAYMRAYGFTRQNPLYLYYILYKDEAKLLKSFAKKENLEDFFRL